MNTMKFPKNNFETKIRLKNYFREIGKLILKLISVLWDKTKNWKMPECRMQFGLGQTNMFFGEILSATALSE
jgi:hypothetical protein